MSDLEFDVARADATLRSAELRRAIIVWAGRIALGATLLSLWQIGAGSWFSDYWFSSPVLIAKRLSAWMANGSLLSNLGFTLTEMAVGLAIGCGGGIVAGFGLGLFPRIAALLEPLIIALYNIPKLALTPLFILWFGIDMGPKIVLVALVTFFLMFINTLSGVRNVNRDLINSVLVMGATPIDLAVKLLLPASAPFIQTGLRICLPYALTSAVAGEMMISQRGLGHMVRSAANMMDMSGVYAALLVLLVLGVALDLVAGAARFSRERDAQPVM